MTREARSEAPAARGGAGAFAHGGTPTAGGPSTLSEAVRVKARELGFGLVGITTPEPTDHLGLYRRWIGDDRHGAMAYLARPDAVARRGDLGRTLPGVRSVIVIGHEYYQEDPPGVPDDASRGAIARYARGRDYHKVVKKKLVALGKWMGGSWRAYVDTGPILERDLARRAGLGWFGKNTMLINPRKGSYFFLGVLLTDLELEPDAPFEADHCGTCTACLDACPTGALLGRDADGAPVMDATRCISYLTIEHRGEIPAELAARVGNRVYGCDICQEVCPWNVRFAEVAAERDYAARGECEAEWLVGDVSAEPSGRDWPTRGARSAGVPRDLRAQREETPDDAAPSDDDDGPRPDSIFPGTDAPSLVALMRMDEDEWNSFTRGSAIRRAGYSGLLRNVAIGLGNWLAGSDTPDPDAVGELVAALSDEDPVVAAAAAWALGRVRE